MMVRRSPRAAARFAKLYEPTILSSAEYQSLRRISKEYHVPAKMRKLLLSKGLVGSEVASKCTLTCKGEKSLLEAMQRRESINDDPQERRDHSLLGREKWLAKYAPPFSRAAA